MVRGCQFFTSQQVAHSPLFFLFLHPFLSSSYLSLLVQVTRTRLGQLPLAVSICCLEISITLQVSVLKHGREQVSVASMPHPYSTPASNEEGPLP